LDSFEAARAFVASLRRSQWLTPDALAAYQAPLIERLCRHAAMQTDFYDERLNVLFEHGDPRAGRFLFEHWSEVPIFGRAEAQAVNDQLHARATPEAAGPSKTLQTSGSTGEPFTFRRSGLMDIAGLARTELGFELHGFDPSGRMGWTVLEGAVEQERRGWTLRNPDSELFCLLDTAPIHHAVDWLRRIKPRYLMGDPSFVSGLIDQMRDDGGPRVRLEGVCVTSEVAPETLAQEVFEAFGARLVDNYGGSEVGEIASTCPDQGPAKHVSAETMLVELITLDGKPAKPGEMARVVITPFYSYATPLIRYDIGDIVIRGEAACACGRGAPLIARVLGRQNALFRFQDGSTRFPIGLDPVKTHLRARQMQIVQAELMRIEVRYTPDLKAGRADFQAAAAVVRDALWADVQIDFVAVERMEQNPVSGKFEGVISLVTAPDHCPV
jgi:phenylacetate-CoA ligase